jgi:hypothetical protein
MMRSDSPQTPHREVLMKVNAYVDERIAPLVQLLNSINGMMTWDSCEGEPLHNPATLCLCPGRLGQVPVNKVKAFARDLSKALADGGCRHTKVQLDWSDMKTFAWILLTMPQDDCGSGIGETIPGDDVHSGGSATSQSVL